MANQLELVADERTISGKQVKQLREKGIVPANVFGRGLPSMAVQLNRLVLQKVLYHGGKDVILMLKVGDRPSVPVMIKDTHRDVMSGTVDHVDFYMVNANEKLKTPIRLHFINETGASSQGEVVVQRSLNEVMVECLPANLPSAIQVDLSMLKDIDAVIRVGDLTVGPGVTILTDPNELVAAVHLQAHLEKVEGEDDSDTAEKTEAPSPA